MGRHARRRSLLLMKRRVFEVLEIVAYDDWVAVLVNRVIIGCIGINIAAIVIDTDPQMHKGYGLLAYAAEGITVWVFILEYVARLWACTVNPQLSRQGAVISRVRYALGPIALVDLIAILPPFFALITGVDEVATFTAFRLLRFLKLARYSPGMRSLVSALASEKRAIIACGVIMLGLIIAAGTVMHALEGHIQPERMGSIPLAMYWAVTTLTTVGYGDVVPVTASGKAFAGFVMLCGFTMFALPVGIIATAFAREIHAQDFVVTWSLVARVPLFNELSAQEVAEVMKMLRSQNVEAGTMITRRGESAESMYFIVSGTVEIHLDTEKIRLTDGAFFGEMAVLKRARRSANILAVTRCKLLILDAADLHYLMQRQPNIAHHIHAEADARAQAITPRGDLASAELSGAQRVKPEPDLESNKLF